MSTEIAQPERKSKRSAIHRFIERNRMNVGLTVSFTLQMLVMFFWYTPEINFGSNLDHLVEEVAFVDNVQIQDTGDTAPEDGDIELTDKKKVQEEQDPRIAGAQDAAITGATAPVDLSPDNKPEYTDEAKAGGVTGSVTLEVIISESGDVLQVRSVGKKLGFGLDESAIKTFKRKKYSPSILEGKPITVKVLIPVRFTLN
ncbi:MAG: energy transducer TonB [Leptospiraceae bacterium]|nr:energy transducer TonB [Leptospiraceae bacterium]